MIHDRRDTFGGYLEDFAAGDVYKHWPGKTVTEMDNHLFSLLTMNHNPLHIDAHHMSKHQHGQILVNGAYVLSLVVGMSVPEMSGKAIAKPGVREHRPYRPDVPRGYDLRRERDTGRPGVEVEAGQGHCLYRDPRPQPARGADPDDAPHVSGPKAPGLNFRYGSERSRLRLHRFALL